MSRMCTKKSKKEGGKNNICDLRLGEKGIIAGTELNGALKTRLTELGFIEGEQIECVLVSPLKDPIAFKVCDLVIALRREDAKHILLRKEPAQGKRTQENKKECKNKAECMENSVENNENNNENNIENIGNGAEKIENGRIKGGEKNSSGNGKDGVKNEKPRNRTGKNPGKKPGKTGSRKKRFRKA